MGNVKKISAFNEMLFYITVCIGMAVSNTSFTIVSGMFEVINGFWLPLSIVTSGVICWIISRQIAELAGIFPSAPGIRTYLIQGFSNQISLFFVFLYILFMIMIGSVESFMFASVVQSIFPSIPALLIILFVITYTVIVNIVGFRLSRKMQIISTSAMVLGITLLGVMGLSQSSNFDFVSGGFSPPTNIGSLFLTSIGFSLFLFVGFEWVTPLGLNSKAYTSKIPRAMQYAIVANIIMYAIFCMGIMPHFTSTAIAASNAPQAMLAEKVFGYGGLVFALGLSVFAITSTFNAGIMGGARLLYGVSREGYLPQYISKVSVKMGTPVGAILTLSILVAILSFFVVQYKLELIFAVIGSSIICFVYGMLLWSLIRIKSSGKKIKIQYTSGLPLWVQYTLIVMLMVFGLLSVFSIITIWKPVLYGLAFALVCAWLLTRLVSASSFKMATKKKD